MSENNWIRGKNISVCPASQFYPSNITKQKTGWQPYKWITSRVLIKQVMCRLDKGSGLESYFIAESWCHLTPIHLMICAKCKKTSLREECLRNHLQSQHMRSVDIWQESMKKVNLENVNIMMWFLQISKIQFKLTDHDVSFIAFGMQA